MLNRAEVGPGCISFGCDGLHRCAEPERRRVTLDLLIKPPGDLNRAALGRRAAASAGVSFDAKRRHFLVDLQGRFKILTAVKGSLTQRYVKRHSHARTSREIRRLRRFSSSHLPLRFPHGFRGALPAE